VIDCAAAFNYLRGRADAWAGLAPTGATAYTPTDVRWAITLAGPDPAFNVFTVDGSKLSAASSFTINAPASATVLVNVTGASGKMENFGFFLNGVSRQRVLFNFPQYTSLRLNSIGVMGSVLAPRAAVDFAGGNLDGTLVAAALSGPGELHHHPFLATCSSATSAAFTVTVQPGPAEGAPKFFVVGSAAGARYTAAGGLLGTSALAAPDGVTVGVAANANGTATWTATAATDGTTVVTGYDPDGSVRGSWRAYGVTDARDLGAYGADVWVVGRDAASGALKVFRFKDGTKVRSGGLEPAAAFALTAANTNPTGLATDGWNVFVTDKNAAAGRVFAYDVNGNLLGNPSYNPWRLDARNADPTGVALNPNGGGELWVVDRAGRQVFTYANGRNNQWWNSGARRRRRRCSPWPPGPRPPRGLPTPGRSRSPSARWSPGRPGRPARRPPTSSRRPPASGCSSTARTPAAGSTRR
jgi:hypothetical protein